MRVTAVVVAFALSGIASAGLAFSPAELVLWSGQPFEARVVDALTGPGAQSSFLIVRSPSGTMVAVGNLDCGASWLADFTGDLPDLQMQEGRLVTGGCEGRGEPEAAAAYLSTLAQVRHFQETGARFELLDAAGTPRLVLQRLSQP
ncbi:hypothetical protein [Falsigemmobacter faecalis]|uniref:META domain-containing protein n=1 Tax=Falsigemmobacter faecalis TaxID=2488730 RepID=A0A3P3DVT1_9RHOB|nr:hypothetical protein [Falsigemmobacter faecalis]RRH78393.1 hypothetical protein EG244_00110 [Falsigemmobacter faecalis]